MTEAIPPLTVDIIFNTSGVNAGITAANAGLTKITEQSKLATGAMGRIKETMLGVFGGSLATQGFMAIEHAVMEAKQEFLDTQVALQNLNTAMDNMGIKSKETRESVIKNAEAFSKMGFEGRDSVDAMKTLITTTGNVTQANKLMMMAADFSRYKHGTVSMAEAATMLARATTGNLKAFKQMGITLDSSLPKNKAIAKAFDELNAKIGGQAMASMNTFEVQMKIMKERLQDIFNVVAKMVIPVLNFLFKTFNAVAGFVERNSAAFKALGLAVIIGVTAWKAYAATLVIVNAYQRLQIALALASAEGLTTLKAAQLLLNDAMKANQIGLIIAGLTLLAAAFVYAWNHVKWFRDAVAEALGFIVKMIGYLVGGVATLIRLLSKLPGGKLLKGIADEADKVALSIGKASKAVEDLKNKKAAASKTGDGFPTGGVKPGDVTGITGNVIGDGGGGTKNVQYVTVFASDTNDIYRKLSKAAKNGQPLGVK